MAVTQEQVLAFAIYEIRLLLAHHLGSGESQDPATQAAAHLAYALHNQAATVLQGGQFNPEQATLALGALDQMLATSFQPRLFQAVRDDV
ncbi:hypothetical protein [Stenotrophomonas humi]|uniref:hypothetical protein n=1 Tax=Stenotrophomonas humi TaxID=405444 RepID=UPI00070DC904|nr:hypothetical protein [Stenotrophomonas humi]